eukprot:UN25778
MQVEDLCRRLLKYTPLSCQSLSGLQQLHRDPKLVPDILITTPLCFQENFKRTTNKNRHVNFLSRLQFVVMDEADMLMVGCYGKPIKYFLRHRFLVQEKNSESKSGHKEMNDLQYIFCAATLPTQAKTGVSNLLRDIWANAEWISTPGLHRPSKNIEQNFKLVVPGEQLIETEKFLESIHANGKPEKNIPPQRVLMFVNKPEHAWSLSNHLREKGFKTYSVTSRMDNAKGWEILTRFQEGSIQLLIGTDLLCRGIDFRGIDWIVNIDFPENVLFYLHRLGRTGRAGTSGKVLSFYTVYELDLANSIQAAAEGKGSYQYCFSRKRSFRRRLIRAEERGRLQRLSAPKLHELRYDEKRIDPHYRDPGT